ncbi:MAG TPA: Fe-S cluster assembly protein SufD [Thermoflexia bacterium]|nr:Fe-S cluster assembly protein SufD [Thermoflexia bacterium]
MIKERTYYPSPTRKDQKLELPVNAAAVAALSAYYAEPAWLRESRREAWELYAELPWPDRQEEPWRRVPLHEFPLAARRLVLSPPQLSTLEELPPCWLLPDLPRAHCTGLLIHNNGGVCYADLEEEARDAGVVLQDLHRALESHEELIRRHWLRGAITRPDFNKFTALNAALWHGGTFVYVPAGVRVERPLRTLTGYDAAGGTGLHHTLIVAEQGAKVTVIQERYSLESEPELNSEIVEIYAAAGAWIRYISLQNWGKQRYTVSVQNAQLERDAHLVWGSGSLGGAATKEFLRTELRAPRAHAVMRGFTFATGQQRLDQSTYQHQLAPDTYSDLLFRNVLRDQSRTVFYGMIRMEQAAQNSAGYQANNNLLLDQARAHSIPGLEIMANEVSCSHGATVSRLDPEQLFYLLSRAIPREEAEYLLVQGFLNPIIEHVPLSAIRAYLAEEIARRFWQAAI